MILPTELPPHMLGMRQILGLSSCGGMRLHFLFWDLFHDKPKAMQSVIKSTCMSLSDELFSCWGTLTFRLCYIPPCFKFIQLCSITKVPCVKFKLLSTNYTSFWPGYGIAVWCQFQRFLFFSLFVSFSLGIYKSAPLNLLVPSWRNSSKPTGRCEKGMHTSNMEFSCTYL